MELRKPKDLLLLLRSSDYAEVTHQIFTHIVQQIKELEGVVGVNVDWPENGFLKKQ